MKKRILFGLVATNRHVSEKSLLQVKVNGNLSPSSLPKAQTSEAATGSYRQVATEERPL